MNGPIVSDLFHLTDGGTPWNTCPFSGNENPCESSGFSTGAVHPFDATELSICAIKDEDHSVGAEPVYSTVIEH